jgi:hypothetical protein
MDCENANKNKQFAKRPKVLRLQLLDRLLTILQAHSYEVTFCVVGSSVGATIGLQS